MSRIIRHSNYTEIKNGLFMEIADKNVMMKVLDSCYEKALTGLPTSESVYDLADEYCRKYSDPKVAAKKLCNAQVLKCGTSGFITGLGGIITMPVAIPANISSVIYVQLRMVAAIARIGGYDPSDDEVRTMAYVCITGTAAADILKKNGIVIGEKGAINLVKLVPVAGGLVGGGVDIASTKTIAKVAYKMFIEGKVE